MPHKKEDLQLPPEPEWAITSAVKMGALYALVGAAIGAIGSKTPVLKALYKRSTTTEAIEAGAFTGMIGAFFGYVDGARKHAEYPHRVENAKLKQKINELETEQSFAQTVIQEDIEKNTGFPPARG